MTSARLRTGRRGERHVAAWLEARGYVICGMNVRIGRDEIDVVAKKDDLLVVCEVRTRTAGSLVSPLASIDERKRRTILRAALALWRDFAATDASVQRFRIDVAGVTLGAGEPEVSYAEGALTEES